MPIDIVYEYLPHVKGYAGTRYRVQFRDVNDFKEYDHASGESPMVKVVSSPHGVSEEESLALCERGSSSISAAIKIAESEATDPEAGRIDQRKLDHNLRKQAMIMAERIFRR